MPDPFSSMLAGLEGAGLSLAEIARRSGLSRQTLHRIKNHEARAPTHDTFTKLDRVARAYFADCRNQPVRDDP